MKKIGLCLCLIIILLWTISCKEKFDLVNSDMTLKLQAFILLAGSYVYMLWLKLGS